MFFFYFMLKYFILIRSLKPSHKASFYAIIFEQEVFKTFKKK